MNNFISKRAQKFETSGIRKIFNLASGLKKPVNFSLGQPDFGPTKKVKQKTIEAIKNGFCKYTPTPGIETLRIMVAQKLALENKIKTTAEKVIITPGTSAAFFLALSTVLNLGDEVIIPDPYFVEYPTIVEFLDAKPVFLDTYPDFQINIKKLKSLITNKTKLIILNSPNNPAGAVYPEKTLREIAKIAAEKEILIISDEIYEKFIYDGIKHFSIGSIYQNTITIGGLSKSGGIPGWRIGWATGPQEIIDKMVEIQLYTFVSAPSLVQYGALAAFDLLPKDIKNYQSKRDLIFNLISQKFEITKPQGAFYVMPKVDDAEKFVKLAIKNNVLLIPGNAFSQKNTHVRISYAVSDEDIKKGCQILLKI